MALLDTLTRMEVDSGHRKIMAAYFGAALAALAVGGAMAIILVITRMPAVSYENSRLFYQALTAHGLLAFVFWLIFFEVGLLIVAGTLLLGGEHLWSLRLAWAAFGLMVAGMVSALAGVFSGAAVLYTAFPPLAGQFGTAWLVYLAFVLLALGSLLIQVDFLVTVFRAARRRGPGLEGWLVLIKEMHIASFAALAGMIMSIPGTLVSLKLNVPALLWSLGAGSMSAMDYRMTWALMFHVYHYIPAMVMIGVAYVLAELTTGAQSIYAKNVAKGLFLLYPFFVPPTFLYHLLVDPSIPANVRAIGSALSLLVGTPSILHMFIILGMIEARMRSAGHGLFGWLRHLPWSNPAFGSMIMGMATMGLAGVFGYQLLQEQFSPLLHGTFAVPAYLHPMAAGGASLIFMGACYYGVAYLSRRRLWGLRVARWQPYLMTAGLVIFLVFGMAAGYQGVPRRTPHIDYAGLAPASWMSLMNVAEGVGGTLMIIAGGLFVATIAATALWGERVTSVVEALRGMEPPALEVREEYRRSPVALLPGATFVVVGIVLTLFTFAYMNVSPILFR